MISSICSIETINTGFCRKSEERVPNTEIASCVPASIFDAAAAVNPDGIEKLLANGLSIFLKYTKQYTKQISL